jgi:hypothetical protein
MTRPGMWVMAMALVCGLALLLFADTSRIDMRIVGTWKLTGSSGGLSGGGRIPLPDMTVEFTEDGEVTWYEDGELTYSASYSTGVDKTIFSLDPLPVICLADGRVYGYSFLDSNTLVLTDNVYDGYQDEYRRA